MALRIPPVVGQNVATLPDGALDPAHADDCGESTVTSANQAINAFYLPPGCIRVTVGSQSGITTAENLSWILRKLHLSGDIVDADWSEFHQLRHHGRYLIGLGQWIAPQFEHWMLFYQSDPRHVYAMDPWTARHVKRDEATFTEQYAHVAVVVKPQ